MLKDIFIDDFQYVVDELLIRNKSILDSLTKFSESAARVNRSIIKSVTNCGCIRINAKKQEIPIDVSLKEAKKYLKTHVEGQLCENCRDLIEKEIGSTLFYLASICNTLDLNLYDIIIKEIERMKTLGEFNLR
ncbi:hypothetical protein B0S90_2286 [Caldicellulosiruptor bescii]|uniref:DUF1573 domain-containing protein n=6 Tax=Caldicellulosiruptor TaxID=44000 RepID=E4Q478_CALOW|nr:MULTISPECIES: hypothetical protein [Caldicellulosiruptor]ACM61059.1 conserved hypothetical protein [Caldicellulosiruptor bescii DSM 6725]ADL43050.1 hypothetical protein COB47_1773 [Caldicellulosiruptor obsidiansis OB47]ADQ05232.1 hypothetical protein Calow_1687 [Caldicellulosiruptor owensensis OL]ADQ06548.1 conserved hypothetical protein [Caldicellulosiruptor hydrothermalis 108]ADQ45611.1 hypothetical protein Calkro_0720 [Caldicellulosiruptor kronotskyensis 2002]